MSFALYVDDFNEFWKTVKELQKEILRVARELETAGKSIAVYSKVGKTGINIDFQDLPEPIVQYFKDVIRNMVTLGNVKYTRIIDHGKIIEVEITTTQGE